MNKKLLATALFAVCGGTALALPAFAQTSPNDTQAQAQTTAVTSNPQAAAPAGSKRAVPPLDSRFCIRETGSHIPPPKGQCLPVAGNSYSQKDIQRTGATNIGQALQMLDPSVTVHGH
ncbi:MAG: hypothetical protein KJS83_07770 [Xanthomonadaceae bacterium]|nr:hypothetical protein [Xanthomonadaceae bacterium]MBU6476291.1 hypothetical protein [Xanthomonadaceae bacterium]MDE2053404.1 hypothetical protein [Xanthomonadaceae bacterium]MDE2224353.1 hypothetical protein [Xanthomonadaceae bacterium]MDE2497097.1 hypothetical protein [Xanthomonadaceae bacterium]